MTTQTENRKNIVYSLNQNVIDHIISLSSEFDLNIETFEGVLNDSFIIEGAENIKVKGSSRQNIIILCSPENIWSSSLELIMTDDFEEVEKYRQELAA